MTKELDYLDKILNYQPLTLVERTIIECIKEKIQRLEAIDKLQEQLGCPFEVIFKALQNGVYYEDIANCMKYMPVDLHLNLEGEYVLYFSDEEYLLTKNYKKTWWLKKDKSE